MSFLDWLKNLLFENDKSNVQLISKDLTKIKGSSDKFEVALYTNSNAPLNDKKISFVINGVNYEKNTNSDGVAGLNINLNPGTYIIYSSFEGDEKYNHTNTTNSIRVRPRIITQDLTMQEKDGNKFIATAVDNNGSPLEGINVNFKVNGVNYSKTTDNKGEAKLSINLLKGDYGITTTSFETSVTNKIHIKEKPKKVTRMEGTNINKAKSDSTAYQCAVYDEQNNRVACEVDITINDKTYTKKTDSEGLAKLNINLNPGSYSLTAKFNGNDDYIASHIVNTVVIVEDPVKKVYNPIVYDKQDTNYTCGPSCMQMASGILGKPTSESKFRSACQTTTSGTSPSNLISGSKKLGFKLTTISRNINGVKNAIDSSKPVVAHIQTKGVSCLGWSGDWGHYVLIYNYSGNYYKIADPMHGFGTCKSTAIDNATQGRDIKYYSVELE